MRAQLEASASAARRPRRFTRFVALDTDVVALTHARVIDGTGAAAKADQTLIIRNGRVASIGNSGTTPLPAGAMTMGLTGKSLIPGLVMVHEHLHYPTGPGAGARAGPWIDATAP
ncbi:MAG: hypothetical protein ACREPM_20825 [Gemmatimonadaceae bacterium]